MTARSHKKTAVKARTSRPRLPPLPASWIRAATWAVIGIGAVALIYVAFALHKVGDYMIENDFYSGYVQGAKLFQSGQLDPIHYRVVGPVYDVLLGLVEWPVGDFVVAGKLIAIASVVGTWVLWAAAVRSRLGDAAAFWTTLFMSTNAVLFQVGHSLVSFGVALCAQSASLLFLARSRTSVGAVIAGLLAGVATLTRYPAVVLVPAAWLEFLVFDRTDWKHGARRVALHLLGFLLLVGPWVAFSMSRGHVPGEVLVQRADFYLSPAGSQNVQDMPGAFADSLPEKDIASLESVVERDAWGFARHVVTNLGDHFRRDALQLLGWPVAVLVGLGVALCIIDGSWRTLTALCAPWLLFAILLAPVFYNPLYALPLVPFYLLVAGVGIASPRLGMAGAGLPLKALLGLVVAGLAVNTLVSTTRFAMTQYPVEVVAAGKALAGMASPADNVMARKGQIGYYSGRPVVAFPRVETLAELASYCSRNDVGWIYFSWYELMLRPEFAYLLDTTATVPGLRLVHRTERQPSSLFRIEPGFGQEPTWYADSRQKSIHVARATVQVLEDHQAWSHYLVLANDAASRRDAQAMVMYADAAIRGKPDHALAWAMRGVGLQALGRKVEARDALLTALRYEPGMPMAERALQQLR